MITYNNIEATSREIELILGLLLTIDERNSEISSIPNVRKSDTFICYIQFYNISSGSPTLHVTLSVTVHKPHEIKKYSDVYNLLIEDMTYEQ